MGICLSCRRRERKAPEKKSLPGAGVPAKGAAAAELLPRRSNRLLTMANSMSNIKMTNPIKGIVSKRRRRYQKDGFNLDLAYITDRLIAMGFPAEKLEGVYRNHIDEVYRFLEKMHKDHYKIYNLCSERSYDITKFHKRVETYAFEDHTPPKIEIIQPFCEDVDKWLNADPKNVAAVHCKAGKGRTGTMVCCYLLYSGQKATADEALKFYGTKRTHDEKGVTIPSQRRYVEYYGALLRSGLPYAPSKVHVRELVMSPPPALPCTPELSISQAKPSFKAPMGGNDTQCGRDSVLVRMTQCTPLCGDVRVDVYNRHKMKMRKEKLFHFWFNTFFVTAELGAHRVAPMTDSPDLETFKLILNKWQLDDAHKDKQHKHYSQDFKVELTIQKMPESSTFRGHAARAPSPPSSSSSGSEPDTEPDAHWDSGERIPYERLPEHPPPGDCLRARDYSAVSAARRDYSPVSGDCRDYSPVSGDCRDYSPVSGDCRDYSAVSGDRRLPSAVIPPECLASCADEPMADYGLPKETDSEVSEHFYRLSSDTDPFYNSNGSNSDAYLLADGKRSESAGFYLPDADTETADCYYKLSASSRGAEATDNYYKLSTNGKKSEGISRTRLSLGDVRASWREFSGKFASDNRKKKDDS